jgi:hypothetical protein
MANTTMLKSSYGILGQDLKTITLKATAGGGVTSVYLGDSCGLLDSLGIVGGVTSQEFDVTGDVTALNLQEFLKTNALIIGQINYSGNVASQMDFDPKIYRATVSGSSVNIPVSAGIAQNPENNNDKLLSFFDQPFVLDNQTGIVISTVPTNVVTFSMQVLAIVPYGKLEEFLATTPIQIKGCNC